MQEAKITEIKINEARENYRPAAERASLLYFILNDLNKISPIYQFSLKVRPPPGASGLGGSDGVGQGRGGGQGAGVPPAREERGPSPASLPRSLCGPSQAFNVVFENAIQKTAPADEVRQRVMNLTDEITYSVYMYTARGLFERDKLIFLAQVAFQVTRPGRQPPRPEPVGWGAAASGRGAPRGVSERSGPRQGDGPTATE